MHVLTKITTNKNPNETKNIFLGQKEAHADEDQNQ